jgi:hypothetical protein
MWAAMFAENRFVKEPRVAVNIHVHPTANIPPFVDGSTFGIGPFGSLPPQSKYQAHGVCHLPADGIRRVPATIEKLLQISALAVYSLMWGDYWPLENGLITFCGGIQ